MKDLRVGKVYVCMEERSTTWHWYQVGQRFRLLEHSKKTNKIHYFVELEMLDIVPCIKQVLDHESIMDIFVLERVLKIQRMINQDGIDIICAVC